MQYFYYDPLFGLQYYFGQFDFLNIAVSEIDVSEFDVEQWNYYASKVGISFYDPAEVEETSGIISNF